MARNTSTTKLPTETIRRRRRAGQKKKKQQASSSSSDLSTYMGLQQQNVHTYLSHQSSIFSSFIYLVLSSCCVTFFLICCSHPDFGIFVGHVSCSFMFHTFFGIQSSVTLTSAYYISSKVFIFKFYLLILHSYFLKIVTLLSLVC